MQIRLIRRLQKLYGSVEFYWHPWHVMNLLDEAIGFREGDNFVKYYMLNRLTFKVRLYNMFQ